MITLTTGQLETWLAQVLWPFVRIGACFMVAPAFGAVFVPARIRIVLAGAVTLAIAPILPAPAAIAPFSAAGIVVTVQQLVIGVALGFSLQLLFDAVSLGGQLLANSMGLSFAFNIDPLRGAEVPALGQFYTILVMLTFMALNGHLVLIEVLVDGFRTLPIGTSGLGQDGLWTVVQWGSTLFVGALSIALPGVTALLIVNVAFGVMSRAAPQLNLFAVGFPAALLAGIVLLAMAAPVIGEGITGAINLGLEQSRRIAIGG